MRAPFAFIKSGAAVAAPVLTSMTPALADTLGGTPLLLKGTGMGAVSAVTVGGTACTNVIAVDANTVRAVSPIKAANVTNAVICTNSGGSSNSLNIETWHPSQIASGVPRIYDSTVGVAVTGALVNSWADQGSGAQNMTAVTLSRPHQTAGRFGDNVRPSNNFVKADNPGATPGDEMTLAVAITIPNLVSKFWVSKTTLSGIATNSGTVVGQPGGGLMSTGFDTGAMRVYDADAGINHKAGSEVTDGSPRVLGVTQSGVANECKFYMNGALISTQTSSSAGPAWKSIGGASISDPFDGELACVVVVEAVLTAAEITKLTQWMHGKFCSRSYATHRVQTNTPWSARDGGGLLALANGDLYVLGGWNSTPGFLFNANTNKTTNEVWKSTDRGVTWTNVLAGDYTYPNATRWTPRHNAGWVVHNNLLFVIGADVFNGAASGYYPNGDGPGLADVWSSPDGVTWTRRTNTAPWGPRVLQMATSYGGNLYVMGGQTVSADPTTAMSDVWRSTDNGVSWTQITAAAGWIKRGGTMSPLPVYAGKLWMVGGGAYDLNGVNSTFMSDVWTYDGTTWVQVAADGAAPWKKRQYHSVLSFDGKLWVINGFGPAAASANIADIWTTTDGITWTEQTIVPWAASHADGMAVLTDRIMLGPGNGSVGQGPGAGTGNTFEIVRTGTDVTTTQVTFQASGTFTVPAGVFNLTVECFGSGAGGGITGASGGGGGGGGAYARINSHACTPAEVITVTVPAGGAVATDGGDAWFRSAATILAKGARAGVNGGAAQGAGGAGGQAAACIGGVVIGGGAGGGSGVAGTLNGGGGGGGGGDIIAGAAGTSAGVAGLAGSNNGGTGGTGAAGAVAATAAAVNGAGGGGASTGAAASAGARGEVRITYSATS